jgi:hypothetical protein
VNATAEAETFPSLRKIIFPLFPLKSNPQQQTMESNISATVHKTAFAGGLVCRKI